MEERELLEKKICWAMDKASVATLRKIYKILLWMIGQEE